MREHPAGIEEQASNIPKENGMKRIYLALMAVIGLIALAACGSSGSSAQGNSPSPSFTPPRAPRRIGDARPAVERCRPIPAR